MAVIGVDLGGTKLAAAVFSRSGEMFARKVTPLDGRSGRDVGALISEEISALMKGEKDPEAADDSDAAGAASGGGKVTGIGISVPGIYRAASGTVWAPNIPGWEDYPLLEEVTRTVGEAGAPVRIDSDRACYILGETWMGAAKGCSNAIFLAVGTGIGAGVLCDGRVIRGHGDIAGAVGWMGLHPDFREEYTSCGCFEYHASGAGIAKSARDLLDREPGLQSVLRSIKDREISTQDVFEASDEGDTAAGRIVDQAIRCWGMAAANLVSTFNPEIIVFGGGVFGPAAKYLDDIAAEARKWAQPISMRQVRFQKSQLGGDAGLIGAGRLGLGEQCNDL